jgi:hypothetical protein
MCWQSIKFFPFTINTKSLTMEILTKNDLKAFGRSSKISDSNFANLNTFLNPMTQTCNIIVCTQMIEHTQKWVETRNCFVICVDFVTIF